MRSFFAACLLSSVLPWSVLCQTTPGVENEIAQQSAEPEEKTPGATLPTKQGPPTIKNKDIVETKTAAPFKRMPHYVLQDQGSIWTSPFHTKRNEIKWWAIFGGATAALIATDKYTVKEFPNTTDQVAVGTWSSRIGAAYSLIPISAGFYLLGTKTHDQKFRETGILCFETLIDTTIVETIVKSATDRARPLESDGKGHFWDSSGGPYNASFPSGHAINTWALASVIAHEYSNHKIVPVLAYGFASIVVVARLAARKHFPGDVVAGGVTGWFIGDYVYGRRHNPNLDEKASAVQKVLAHVRIGLSF
ncbi:MAG TPA: phosphatase PAP2 family protein [Bryobacteraceae bacterium]|nr:phosphatase PAP2 family protein [Bryobacteraceae bacterium]